MKSLTITIPELQDYLNMQNVVIFKKIQMLQKVTDNYIFKNLGVHLCERLGYVIKGFIKQHDSITLVETKLNEPLSLLETYISNQRRQYDDIHESFDKLVRERSLTDDDIETLKNYFTKR
jgi:hypothetical protein